LNRGRHLYSAGRPPRWAYWPFLLWPNGWMHQDATWFGGRPHHLSPGNFVLDGDSACPPQKGQMPNFRRMSIVVKRLHVWIKMSLGTEVGLGLRDIMLDGAPAPLKVHSPLIFGQCPLWSNGWMD